MGNPLGEDGDAVKVGPVVSEQQLKRVLSFIESGKQQGATLATGGEAPLGVPVAGYYIAPTVFTDVTPDMRTYKNTLSLYCTL